MPGSIRRHLITGASAGMGAACASALAARGDAVIAVARRADVLSNRFGDVENVTVVAADVGHADGRSAILEAVTNQTDDPLTSVIHGAASAVELQPWHQLDPDVLTAHFHVHVASSIAITGSVHNQVGDERCVIFDSYSASTPRVGWSAYSILKAAAQMAFRAAAEELEEVAIARVYPGAVKTPLLARVLDAPRSIEATAVYHDLHDTGRVSTAEEIAEQLLPILDLSPAEIRAQDIWPIGYPA